MWASLGKSADGEIRVILLRSRDRALAPYRRIRTGLLILVLIVALGGIGGSALLARTVTAPVAKLAEGTQQVAAGNLDFRLEMERKDELGELARSFNTMVSERKRLEEQFRQSQKMEAVGRLAGGVAHDFNNLLTAITGYAQLIVQRIPPTNRAHNQAEQILKAAERAASLTKQLLAFSRRQVLVLSVLDLNAVVSDMKQMLARLIGEDVELTTLLDRTIGFVRADRGQVEQVVMNLAVNARDAMPNGGMLTIATSKLEVDPGDEANRSGIEPGTYITLTVSDNGIGMDAETRAHLFEPFFTTKETGKGTGLGLATVYGIVQQSSGYIRVSSEVGRGSSFRVLFPRTDSPPEQDASRTAFAGEIEGVETVLLVEDEKVVRDLAELVLRARGYTVLSAPDGHEALAICRSHEGPISLLITDVVMPRMSGAELVRHALGIRPEMKVLFISGYLGEATRDLAAMGSETSFLQKPFTPDTLSRKVREILDFVPQNS
jgi:signal transduction histidine kinase